MCGPCADPNEPPTDHSEYFIGYAKCYQCGGNRRVYQKYGYVFTDPCKCDEKVE
jgi:hypothetical protein